MSNKSLSVIPRGFFLRLRKFWIDLFAGCFDGEENREPNNEEKTDKNSGEDQKNGGVKGDPGIQQVARYVRGVQGQQRDKQGAGSWPMLNLWENACTRVNKGEKIGGEDNGKHLRAVQGYALYRVIENEVHDSCNDRTEAAK